MNLKLKGVGFDLYPGVIAVSAECKTCKYKFIFNAVSFILFVIGLLFTSLIFIMLLTYVTLPFFVWIIIMPILLLNSIILLLWLIHSTTFENYIQKFILAKARSMIQNGIKKDGLDNEYHYNQRTIDDLNKQGYNIKPFKHRPSTPGKELLKLNVEILLFTVAGFFLVYISYNSIFSWNDPEFYDFIYLPIGIGITIFGIFGFVTINLLYFLGAKETAG
jgi:hypothetical protein